MKPNSPILCALVITATLALPGCNAGVASVPEPAVEAAALPVEVAVPEIRDIQATYETTGTLAADAEAPVPARIDGVVVELFVEEGDVVRRGQLLARLDADRSELEMLRAAAELERRERELERLANLHSRGLISSADFESAEYDVASGKAAHDLARLNYEYAHVRATIDGVVSARNIKIGQTLMEGEAAFTVTNTNELVAYLDIPQTELHKFATGQPAALSVDSHPDHDFNATVERLSPTINVDTGTFRATMTIDNRQAELAPGMFGRFTIAWQTHSDALVLPESALVREDTATTVFVVADGEATRRVVTTGIRSGGVVEIVDGLNAGDRVVLRGQSRLRDGSRVLAQANPSDATGKG